MIDNKGKLFGKINIVDLFVMTMIIVLVAGVFYRSRNVSKKAELNIEYQIELNGIREFALPFYEVGAMVFDQKTGVAIGEIIKVDSEPFYDKMTLLDGKVKLANKESFLKIILTCKAPVNVSKNAYMAYGNYEIKTGSTLFIKTKLVEVMGKVGKIKEL